MRVEAEKRKYVSRIMAILYGLMALSGIVLIFGKGRGAGQSYFVRFVRHFHEAISIPFVIFTFIHLKYNWNSIVDYFSNE